MVTLYVGGKPVGTLADAERLLPELARANQTAEFRADDGTPLGTFTPQLPAEPLVPWDPSIDMAELERRMAGEFLTFEEMEKRLGWK